jgi:glycosyltransferase involved in cell wall biosynthesis
LSYELQKIGRRWGVECQYIPNGADPLEMLTVKGGIRLTGRFNIVYSGDKAKWKRTEDICSAMMRLPKDIKLYLTGRKEVYLEKYASENCIFLGWLTKEEQFNVMSQADAFVCTSDQDCNAKLQEYLRWKKPILAYDGEANNFFKNGENALLAKDGDYAPLIERLAADPDLCRRISENAARDIPVYSWAEIAGQFDEYFTQVVLRMGVQKLRV